MLRFLIAVLSTTVFISTGSASDLTVEGDGLELIAEYDLKGGKTEPKFVNEYEGDKLKGQYPFAVFYNTMDYRPDNLIIFFDRDGNIIKILEDRESAYEGLFPLGHEGYYIRAFRGPISLEGWSYTYRLYDPDDNLITEIPDSDDIRVSPSGDFFVLRSERYYSAKDRGVGETNGITKLGIYNYSGSLIGEIYTPTGSGLETSVKGRTVIATDPGVIKTSEYPNLERGTRVFDSSGDLLLTLNKGVCPEVMRGGISSRFLLGHENYICQIGQKTELITQAVAGEVYEIYPKNMNNNTLEVYNVSGDLLWDYDINAGFGYEGSLFISDNGEFLCLFIKSEFKIIVFQTESGRITREISLHDIGTVRRDCFISNDGSIMLVDIANEYNNEIVLYNANDIISTITLPEEGPGKLSGFLSPDGNYILIGTIENVYLFYVKT